MKMELRAIFMLLGVMAVVMFANLSPAFPQSRATLNAVKLRDAVVCGVSNGTKGFSARKPDGTWYGLDIDVCRAVAAAVLGDAGKIKLVPLNAQERFQSLQLGEIDILSRNTTWTHTRDTAMGMVFIGIDYFDGQGFMVRTGSNIKTLDDMKGARICYESGTTTELNLADIFAVKGVNYKPVPFDTAELTLIGFQSGRCDILTSDQSELFSLRLELSKPDSAEVLPLIVAKEPLGPVVRRGDEQWQALVRWVLFSLIDAEELGVTSGNVAQMVKSRDPAIRLLLKGTATDVALGLPPEWVVHVIEQVGNYGEIFDRNVGAQSPLGIPRGLNALWNSGGLMYAPPFR
jgi:general L-amino acid transport system substrate-binding protein